MVSAVLCSCCARSLTVALCVCGSGEIEASSLPIKKNKVNPQSTLQADSVQKALRETSGVLSQRRDDLSRGVKDKVCVRACLASTVCDLSAHGVSDQAFSPSYQASP